ncbi:hypothetical protein BY458DRAFT_428918 [Sporodiniella umbellata]|nr:hypothetical protein BY458DRAFT_428918 [Sporodiniella umbellata]
MISLPRAIGQLHNLCILDASHNQLESIPDTICQLKKLQVLDLGHNRLNHLPKGFHLPQLQSLVLRENQLTQLSQELSQSTELVLLDVSLNPLTSIPAEIASLKSLKKFLADQCPFDTTPTYGLKHDPPSLLEICARQVCTLRIPTPALLTEYMKQKKTCTFCLAPFFKSFVSRKRLRWYADRTIMTLDYSLCTAHWGNEEDRLLAMFSTGNKEESRLFNHQDLEVQEEDEDDEDDDDEIIPRDKYPVNVSSKQSSPMQGFAQLGSRLRTNYFIGDDTLNLPRYKVSLSSEKIPQSQLQDVSFNQNIIMRDASGQPFSCHIPANVPEEVPMELNSEPQDVKRTIEQGFELLKPLSNSCLQFYKAGDQYWSFEYCHQQYIRQFHIEKVTDGKTERKKETNTNTLGLYSPESKAILKQVGDQRSLVQRWPSGSLCDITGKPREVEVQYQCDYQGHDRVSYFTEVSSCRYHIIISTPRLCEEMRLSRLRKSKVHPISCKPIVSDTLIEAENEQRQKEQYEGESQVEAPKKTSDYDSPSFEDSKEASVLDKISYINQQLDALKSQIQAYLPNEQPKKKVPLLFVDEKGNPISEELQSLINAAIKKKEEKPKLVH